MGLQPLAVIVSVTGIDPEFLMYIVRVTDPPGLNDPMFKDVTGMVQALSE